MDVTADVSCLFSCSFLDSCRQEETVDYMSMARKRSVEAIFYCAQTAMSAK